MSERVPSNQIEGIVGAKRHQSEHIIRGDDETGLTYILHPHDCLAQWGGDLSLCSLSIALDTFGVWLPDNRPHRVRLRRGRLIADMNDWKDQEDEQ